MASRPVAAEATKAASKILPSPHHLIPLEIVPRPIQIKYKVQNELDIAAQKKAFATGRISDQQAFTTRWHTNPYRRMLIDSQYYIGAMTLIYMVHVFWDPFGTFKRHTAKLEANKTQPFWAIERQHFTKHWQKKNSTLLSPSIAKNKRQARKLTNIVRHDRAKYIF